MFILDCLASYDMADPKDAEKIAERVLARLQHANSAVVLSAVKVRWGWGRRPRCRVLSIEPVGLTKACQQRGRAVRRQGVADGAAGVLEAADEPACDSFVAAAAQLVLWQPAFLAG